MAPGCHKLKLKSIPNKSQQRLITHTTKDASSNLTPRRGTRRPLDKSNVASDVLNDPMETTELYNGSSERSETARTNPIRNIPRSPTIPSTERPETQSTETQSTENNQDLSTEEDDITDEASKSKKRGRGQTMGKGIMKAFDASGKKMKINVDPLIGRPKAREESAKFSSQIGVVTRDVLRVPKSWKEVDEEKGLEPGIDHIKIHMDINLDKPGVRQCLIDRLKSSTRQKRYRLHQHYKKYATLQEAKNNKPHFCPSKENWDELCDHFESPKFKHQSLANTVNRGLLRAPHISGRTAFTVLQHEMSQKELTGESCDMIDLYKRTHFTEKHGWSREEAKENWELMIERREKYIEQGVEKTAQDIMLQVLGHGSGYRKGLGYDPKPPSRRTTSHDSATQYL